MLILALEIIKTMLTEQEIKNLINKEVIEDTEAISLIRKFIFDKTGKDIKGISRPTGQISFQKTESGFPDIKTDFQLMFSMYFISKSHYLETLK